MAGIKYRAALVRSHATATGTTTSSFLSWPRIECRRTCRSGCTSPLANGTLTNVRASRDDSSHDRNPDPALVAWGQDVLVFGGQDADGEAVLPVERLSVGR